MLLPFFHPVFPFQKKEASSFLKFPVPLIPPPNPLTIKTEVLFWFWKVRERKSADVIGKIPQTEAPSFSLALLFASKQAFVNFKGKQH